MKELERLLNDLDFAAEESRRMRLQLAAVQLKADAAEQRRQRAMCALERGLVEELGGGIVTFFRRYASLDEEVWLRMLACLVRGQSSIAVPLLKGWIELEVRWGDGELVYCFRELPRAAERGAQYGTKAVMKGLAEELHRLLGGSPVIEVG